MTLRPAKLLTTLILTSFCLICNATSQHRTTNLKCESLTSPIAIATTSPYLSWQTRCDRKGATVTAYQILAATTPEKLNENDADLWNSGKVLIDSPRGTEYGGVPHVGGCNA